MTPPPLLPIAFPYILIAALIALLPLAPAAQAGEKVPELRVMLVGDSTMADAGDTKGAHGWGEYLEEHFRGKVAVLNRAAAGESAKSFRRTGKWKEAMDERADFVLIQFGHNDLGSKDPRVATAAAGEYRAYLKYYVEAARERGVQPILITPVSTRDFGGDGRLADRLGPYAEATKAVAAEQKVPLVDLHAQSMRLFDSLGKKSASKLAATPQDNTHFNKLGAKVVAKIVAAELRKVEPRLAGQLKDVKSPVP